MCDDDDVKEYSIFQVPDDPTKFRDMCGAPIGGGGTLCTNRNCTTIKHRKMNKGNLKQGNLYVRRNTNSIFLAPTISSNHISCDMIETWLDSDKSLAAWSNAFRLSANHVKNEATGTLVTSAALKREENFVKQSKAYQTPKRKKLRR